MPYEVEEGHADCPKSRPFAVVGPNRVHGCHRTRDQAEAQQRALYANEQQSAAALTLSAAPAKEDLMSNTLTVPISQGGVDGKEYLGQLAITITVDDGSETAAESEAVAEPVAWKSILAVEGELTRDNGPMPRIIPVNTLTWGELPIPFFAMGEIVGQGHDGQVLVGRIDAIQRIPVEEFTDTDFDLSRVPEGSQIIFGTGVILSNATTAHFLTLMEDRALRGVSIDMVAAQFVIAHADTLEPVEDEFALTIEDAMSGDYVIAVKHAEIGGATAAPMQGIGTATIALVASAVDAFTLQSAFGIFPVEEPAALVAAAPIIHRKSAFFRPEPDHYVPLTVDGLEVYGHAFVWDSCHIGFQHTCQKPKPSPTGYASFHQGRVATIEGEDVWVGQITLDTDHAAIAPGITPEQVWKHYSDTGCAVADVRIVDGRIGGWVSGVVRALPDKDVRTLKAAKLSGDWRRINGVLDLVGLLAVNVNGFQPPQTYMVASAAGDEIHAMVAAGMPQDIPLVLHIDDLEALALMDELASDCGCPDGADELVEVTFQTAADVMDMAEEDYASLGRLVVELASEARLRETIGLVEGVVDMDAISRSPLLEELAAV